MSASKNLLLAGVALSFALPAFAQEAPDTTSSMTCANFLTLDSTAKAEAIVGARESSSSNEGGAMTDPNADPAAGVEPPDATTDGVASSAPASGTGTDNVAAPESTDAPETAVEAPAATTDGVATSEPSTAPVPEGTMAATTAELSTEELVALAETACQTQPDAGISDVLTSMP